jgi:hypothetical protein
MSVQPGDHIHWNAPDGTVKAGRVTGTSSNGMILVAPDGVPSAFEPYLNRLRLVQIWEADLVIEEADLVQVNRALLDL